MAFRVGDLFKLSSEVGPKPVAALTSQSAPKPLTAGRVVKLANGQRVKVPEGEMVRGRVIRRHGYSDPHPMEQRVLDRLDEHAARFPGLDVGEIHFTGGTGESIGGGSRMAGAWDANAIGWDGPGGVIEADTRIGTRYFKEDLPGTHATTTVESVIDHEMGHLFNALTDADHDIRTLAPHDDPTMLEFLNASFGGGQTTPEELPGLVAKHVKSQYAATSPAEAFAEAYATAFQGPATLASRGVTREGEARAKHMLSEMERLHGRRSAPVVRSTQPTHAMAAREAGPASGFWGDIKEGLGAGWRSAEYDEPVGIVNGRRIERYGMPAGTTMEGQLTGQLDELEALFPGTRVDTVLAARGEGVRYLGMEKGAPDPTRWSASMGKEISLGEGETLAINMGIFDDFNVPPGQAATTTGREIVQHEFGHHVHNTILGIAGKSNPDEWDPHLLSILSQHFGEDGDDAKTLVERISRSIGSQYAATDAREAFAEVFTRGFQDADRRALDGIDEVTSTKIDDFMLDVQARAAEAAGHQGPLPDLDWLPSKQNKAYPPVLDANGGVRGQVPKPMPPTTDFSHLPPPPQPTKPPPPNPIPKPEPRPVPPKPIEKSVDDTAEILKGKGKVLIDDLGDVAKKAEKAAPKTLEEGADLLRKHGGKVAIAGAIIGGVGLLSHFNSKRKEAHLPAPQAQVAGDFGAPAPAPAQIPIQTTLGDQNRNRRMAQMMNARQRAGSFLNSGTSSARNGLAVRTSQFG